MARDRQEARLVPEGMVPGIDLLTQIGPHNWGHKLQSSHTLCLYSSGIPYHAQGCNLGQGISAEMRLNCLSLSLAAETASAIALCFKILDFWMLSLAKSLRLKGLRQTKHLQATTCLWQANVNNYSWLMSWTHAHWLITQFVRGESNEPLL